MLKKKRKKEWSDEIKKAYFLNMLLTYYEDGITETQLNKILRSPRPGFEKKHVDELVKENLIKVEMEPVYKINIDKKEDILNFLSKHIEDLKEYECDLKCAFLTVEPSISEIDKLKIELLMRRLEKLYEKEVDSDDG